ncbi:MAG TPA: substrate-binding domain-containing protein [Ramlibacter sp.]|uniref:substrate-binding domain-containing protein n=1 Tax=Ramlibacter sp. TaxID=1917967 RepID=UPI002D16D782|nr:substrate-binding domain-containing protein [Ramlibacter sp.]HVZ44464.1 substrate-binding domain-containing protein [Ramlibacter sp.]
MTSMLRGISSMATRQLLGELAAAFERQGAVGVAIESVGGVDAAKRVQAGEPFDFVVLASDAIDKLAAGGHVVAGSKVDIVKSGVAVAVKAGAPKPDVSSENALKRAVLDAPTLGFSTGPSGVALAKLFERWGIADRIRERIVTAPPGVPVGSLVAKGEVALGFQQLSELIHLDGIAILGPLPQAVQIITTFSAGIVASSTQREAVRALLAFMASAETTQAKRRQGMEAA